MTLGTFSTFLEMPEMRRLNLLLFTLFSFTTLLLQANESKIDSLRAEFTKDKHDTIQHQILLEIGDLFNDSNKDSAIKYYRHSYKIAQVNSLRKHESKSLSRLGLIYRIQGLYPLAAEAYLKAIDIDKETGDLLGVAKSYNNLGLVHLRQGNYQRAISFLEESINIKRELGDKKGVVSSISNLGIVYRNQGYHGKAIEQYLETLRVLEELEDKEGISKCYLNIGNIHYGQANYNAALDYYLRSMHISQELADTVGLSRVYNNIGLIFRFKEDYDKAIEYYSKSLELFKKQGYKERTALLYNNLGGVSFAKGDFSKAAEYFNKSLEIRREIGDKRGEGGSYYNFGELYFELASLKSGNERTAYLDMAISNAQKGYKIAEKIGALTLQRETASLLKNSLIKRGRFREALSYAEALLAINDSIYSQDKTNALADMQAKYETEQKQQEIEKQKLIIEKQQNDNQRQRVLRNFFIAGSIFLALLLTLIIWIYQQKKRSHQLITEKNVLLEQANEEIKATSEALSLQNSELRDKNQKILQQQKEIEEQRNSLANLAWELQDTNLKIEKQKDLLDKKNTQITDSIFYAQRIQNAVLPSIHTLKPHFSDYFILHKPKSIVSGDFYWATQINEWLVFCVADCTGHGVPGAMMSMLGVAFLNEIVRKNGVDNADTVLNNLRDYIIKSLEKQDDESVFYEGMDVGLCFYNVNSRLLRFSGANIPCWIVPASHQMPLTTKDIVALKPDKMPIGLHERMDPFNQIEYQLEIGDRLYVGTDGYSDQIGGSSNKKIQVAGLKRLICKSYELPINEQKKYLHNYFLEWQGEAMQLDDVTLLCVLV